MRVTRAGSSLRDPGPGQLLHRYTDYSEMNVLLNKFVEEARMEGIRVSVDAEELTRTTLGSGYLDIIQEALDTAKTDCINQSSLLGRYIKLRSMNAQKKSFVKILYSCEYPSSRARSTVPKIQEMVEACGGYIKMNSMKGCGCIAIATPNE